jgi:hypothetical protein
MMSWEGESEQAVQAGMARLFAGREPSAAALARAPTLEDWAVAVRTNLNGGRCFAVSGRRKTDRLAVRDTDFFNVPVIWMDRKWRFVLTPHGLHSLGTRHAEQADD